MEWQLTINNTNVTKYVVSIELERQNDLLGGSSISGTISLAFPTDFLPIQACNPVALQFNSNFPTAAIEYQINSLNFLVRQVGIDSDNTTRIEIAQLNGMGLSKAPVIGDAQKDVNFNTVKRAGEIAAGMLNAFNISNSIAPWGLPQYDVQGTNDGDPFGQVAQICFEHGLLMQLNRAGNKITTTSLSSLVNRLPSLYSYHVLDALPIKKSELDELTVVALKKQKSNVPGKAIKETEEIVDERTGDIRDRIVTEIDEFGQETRNVYTTLKFLRPDTHPNSGTMVWAESSNEKTITDNEGRIKQTERYISKNTAIIDPDGTNNNVLIPAEKVVTSYRFNKDTNELTSVRVDTYSVFVIGKKESYTYSPSSLQPKKFPRLVSAPTQPEKKLTDDDKKNSVISPLVLARSEVTTYRKIGVNKWRESLVISTRQLNSETNTDTDPETNKPTVNRIATLGSMVTISNKSKTIYSVPTVQTVDETGDLEERVLQTTLTNSSTCSSFLKRREIQQISSNIDEIAFGQVCALLRIAKMKSSVQVSLRLNASTINVLSNPFSTLLYQNKLWVCTRVKLALSAGSPSDFAGEFTEIKDQVSEIFPPLAPPIVDLIEERVTSPVLNLLSPTSEPTAQDDVVLPTTTSFVNPSRPVLSGIGIPANLATTVTTSGATVVTEPNKLPIITIPTTAIATTPLPQIDVVTKSGSTTISTTPLPSTTPITINNPETELDEDVILPTITVTSSLFPESIKIEFFEHIETTITLPLFPVDVIIGIADNVVNVSVPLFPV